MLLVLIPLVDRIQIVHEPSNENHVCYQQNQSEGARAKYLQDDTRLSNVDSRVESARSGLCLLRREAVVKGRARW